MESFIIIIITYYTLLHVGNSGILKDRKTNVKGPTTAAMLNLLTPASGEKDWKQRLGKDASIKQKRQK